MFLTPGQDIRLIERAVGTEALDLRAELQTPLQESDRPVLRRTVALAKLMPQTEPGLRHLVVHGPDRRHTPARHHPHQPVPVRRQRRHLPHPRQLSQGPIIADLPQVLDVSSPSLQHQQHRLNIRPRFIAPIRPRLRKMSLDLPPYIQRPDDLGEHRQAAPRRDLLLRVFYLEWQDALRYHALALLVKVFTHRVKLVFSTITLYQKGLSCQPPILSAIYGRPLTLLRSAGFRTGDISSVSRLQNRAFCSERSANPMTRAVPKRPPAKTIKTVRPLFFISASIFCYSRPT